MQNYYIPRADICFDVDLAEQAGIIFLNMPVDVMGERLDGIILDQENYDKFLEAFDLEPIHIDGMPIPHFGRVRVERNMFRPAIKIEVPNSSLRRTITHLIQNSAFSIFKCKAAIEPYSDNRYRFFIYSQIPIWRDDAFQIPTAASPTKLFGRSIALTGKSYESCDEFEIERKIVDEDGTVVAEIVGNNVYVLHDIGGKADVFWDNNSIFVFKRLVEEIGNPKIKANQQAKSKDQTRYLELRSSARRARLENLTRDRRLAIQHIDQLTRDLTEAKRALHEKDEAISAAKAKIAEIETDITDEFEKILSIPFVRSISIDETMSRFSVYTEHLTTTEKHFDTYHILGEYRIDFHLAGKYGIRWWNLSRTVNGYQHPHIEADGVACYGNFEHVFPQLVANEDYYLLVDRAITFLQSVNVDDAFGVRLRDWPKCKEPAIPKKKSSEIEAATTSDPPNYPQPGTEMENSASIVDQLTRTRSFAIAPGQSIEPTPTTVTFSSTVGEWTIEPHYNDDDEVDDDEEEMVASDVSDTSEP